MIKSGDKMYILTVVDLKKNEVYTTVYNNREDAVRSMIHDMGELLVNGRISSLPKVKIRDNRISIGDTVTYNITEATYRVL